MNNLNNYHKNISVGNSFLIEGGANDHGKGVQIVLVHKVTEQKGIKRAYCYKFSIRNQSIIAKNHKLKWESIIRPFPFMMWINQDMSAVNADRLEEILDVKFSQLVK